MNRFEKLSLLLILLHLTWFALKVADQRPKESCVILNLHNPNTTYCGTHDFDSAKTKILPVKVRAGLDLNQLSTYISSNSNYCLKVDFSKASYGQFIQFLNVLGEHEIQAFGGLYPFYFVARNQAMMPNPAFFQPNEFSFWLE